MKIIKQISCKNCPDKCDIYRAAKEIGVADNFETLHALFRKHEIISKSGTDVTHSIYIVKGYAKLIIDGINNRDIILYILRKHNYIGLLSFFESVKYSYTAVALDDCHVCMVDIDFVKRLYFSNHPFLIKLNGAFGKSVSEIFRKIISINQKQIRGRIAECILYLSRLYQSNKFNLGVTRKEIGEMAAISEENAVRVLTEFRKEGIVSIRGKEMEIIDLKQINRISELG